MTEKVLLFALVLVPQLLPGLIGKALYRRKPTAFESFFAVLVALVVTIAQGTFVADTRQFAMFVTAMWMCSFTVMTAIHFFHSGRIALVLVSYALAATCGATLNYARNVDDSNRWHDANPVDSDSPQDEERDPDLRAA